MKIDKASTLESIVWQMRLNDYWPAQNRSKINSLANGEKPYSDAEAEKNQVEINFNDLTHTRLAHDARAQFYSAFMKPGKYFAAHCIAGLKTKSHKRAAYEATVSTWANRIMKRSLPYYECYRSKFALNVLHGIGPAQWVDAHRWCPRPRGVEDILLPHKTYLTMENCELICIHEEYTADQLKAFIRGPQVDPGWNKEMVKRCVEWVDGQAQSLMAMQWPEVWSPEKLEERLKENESTYACSNLPTIQAWDCYFLDDDGDERGWQRRIILDAWAQPQAVAATVRLDRDANKPDAKGEFLYNSGTRKFAQRLNQIISFQFADLSAVAPFRYHTIRSLGWLTYAACMVQNRMRCRFVESVFESMMQFFRVHSMEDMQRAMAINLVNKGILPDNVEMVKAADRWQVDAGLVQLGLRELQGLIQENSSSYVQNQNYSADRTEKTKFQVMAELSNSVQLVNAALLQAATYQQGEFEEILRRLMIPNSPDPDVREFRQRVLEDGVPVELLEPQHWEVTPEALYGGGNKAVELQIASQLMEWRAAFEPDAQRQILRDSVLAVTDDPSRAIQLVPETSKVSDSIHDAQVAAAGLLQGLPQALKQGVNHQEYAQALIGAMAAVVVQIQQGDNMGTPKELVGLQNIAGQDVNGRPIPGNGIFPHLSVLAQDDTNKQLVKVLQDEVGQLMNEVKGFAQRQSEAQGQQQQANGGLDAETQAKVQSNLIMAQAKAANTRESHAQKTAQRQISFEKEEQRKDAALQAQLRRDMQQTQIDTVSKDLETAGNIRRANVEAQNQPTTNDKDK